LTDDPKRVDGEGSDLPPSQSELPALPAGCEVTEIDPSSAQDPGRSPPLRMTGPNPPHRPALVLAQLLAVVAAFAVIATVLISYGRPGLGILTVAPAILAFVFVYFTRVPDACQTVVTVGDQVIEVARRPFPGRKRYITKRIVMSLAARESREDLRPLGTYEIVAVLTSTERAVLLDRIPDAAAAVYLRNRIVERWI